MTAQTAAIWILGAIGAAGTLAMIFQTQPLRAALCMLIALTSTSGIYILMNLHLLAFLQLILYAGAVMVLFVVAIAALPSGAEGKRSGGRPSPRAAAVIAAAVLLGELGVLAAAYRAGPLVTFEPGNISALSELLFGRYAFQFELLSLLIFSAIVGAVATAKRRL